MPSQFKQDNPGCDCCDGAGSCEDCVDITQLIISGLGTGALGTCTTDCGLRNGTYLFRESPWSGTACGGSYEDGLATLCSPLADYGEDRWRISPSCGSPPSTFGFNVQILYSGGIYTARVTIQVAYELLTGFTGPGGIYGTQIRQRYAGVWEISGPTCADLAGTLTRITDPLAVPTSTISPCLSTDPGDTGDVCGLFSCTVELA